jgi:hypothetical protein
MKFYLGPYKTNPINPYTRRMFVTRVGEEVILWRELLNDKRPLTCIYFSKIDVCYYSSAGRAETLEEAKTKLDEWLINHNYVLLTQEQFDKLGVLV